MNSKKYLKDLSKTLSGFFEYCKKEAGYDSEILNSLFLTYFDCEDNTALVPKTKTTLNLYDISSPDTNWSKRNKIPTIKKLLNERGLVVVGNKAKLIEALYTYESNEQKNKDSDASEDKYEDADEDNKDSINEDNKDLKNDDTEDSKKAEKKSKFKIEKINNNFFMKKDRHMYYVLSKNNNDYVVIGFVLSEEYEEYLKQSKDNKVYDIVINPLTSNIIKQANKKGLTCVGEHELY